LVVPLEPLISDLRNNVKYIKNTHLGCTNL
jgi:hypothetical protein